LITLTAINAITLLVLLHYRW